jgi:hypothetical protein
MRALQLRREEVYDALLDDEVLAQLPSRMATAYGGRSCVLHWWHTDGTAEIVSHNGYYPDDQMQNYAENFTGTDLWSIRAVRSECVNKVWNADELVLPSEYERSEFYNEWIRQMGDDTFHCLGTVMKAWPRLSRIASASFARFNPADSLPRIASMRRRSTMSWVKARTWSSSKVPWLRPR